MNPSKEIILGSIDVVNIMVGDKIIIPKTIWGRKDPIAIEMSANEPKNKSTFAWVLILNPP